MPVLDTAEIDVDYKNQRIKIAPIHTPKTEAKRYFYVFIFYSLLSLYPMGLIMIIFELIAEFTLDLKLMDYYIIFGITVLASFKLGFIFMMHSILRKKQAETMMAKLSHTLKPKRKLNIDNLRSRNFIFFHDKFSNAILDYRVFGDYARKLKNIKVIKLNNDHSDKMSEKYWGIQFLFSKIPQSGSLSLKYA